MARRVSGFFDELHFTECFLGEPEWRGADMIVPVRSIFACGEHRLAGGNPLSGRLFFLGAVRSNRIVYEYLGDPKSGAGFRPAFPIDEGAAPEAGEDLEEYRFGGVREDPPAWLEWTVCARAFALEIGPLQA